MGITVRWASSRTKQVLLVSLIIILYLTTPSAQAQTWTLLGTDPTGDAQPSITHALYAHQETTAIAGVDYYLLKKDTEADAAGTALSIKVSAVKRVNFDKFVLPLNGLSKILASTWTIYYRAYTEGGTVHCDVDILIRQSDGTIRTTIATNVADSANLGTSYSTVSGTYSFAEYTVVDQTDYLEIDFYGDVTVAGPGKDAFLMIDNQTLASTDQTRAENVVVQPTAAADITECSFYNDGTYVYFKETLAADPDAGSYTYTVYLDKPDDDAIDPNYRIVYDSSGSRLDQMSDSTWSEVVGADVTITLGTREIVFKVLLTDIANPKIREETEIWFVNYYGANAAPSSGCDGTGVLDRVPDSGAYSLSSAGFTPKLVVHTDATVDDDRINPLQSITFTGHIYLQGPATPPPSGEFTVHVGTGGDEKGSGPTDDAGSYSIEVTGESNVGLYTYTISVDCGVTTQDADVVVDKLTVTLSAHDYRVNVGDTATVSWTIARQYDGSAVTSFSIDVDRDGATWRLGMTGSSATDKRDDVGDYAYTAAAVTDNTHDLTAFDSNTITIIWDRVEVYEGGVVDDRINVGDAGTYWFKLRYQYDHVDVDDGWVSLNGTASAAWDAADARWEYGTSREDVVREGYRVAGVGGNAYGITALADEVGTRSIVWDRVKIAWYGVSDDRCDIETVQQVRARAVLDYDGHELGSGDSVTINGVSAKWDAADLWFYISFSSSSVGEHVFKVDGASEADYGITVVYDPLESPVIIWDRLEVYGSGVSDDRCTVGTTQSVWVRLRYDYDDVVFDGSKGAVSIGGIEATWDVANSRWYMSDSRSTVGRANYLTPSGLRDDLYGLKALTGQVEKRIVWDRIKIVDISNDDSRRDVNTLGTIYVTAALEYDGHVIGYGDVLYVEGLEAKWDDANDRWCCVDIRSTPQAVIYDSITGSETTYEITAVNMNGKSTTIVWDRVLVTLNVADDRINVGDSAAMDWTAVYEYDSTAFDGSIALNGSIASDDVGKYGYKVASITDPTYGLTAFTTNTVSVIFDAVEVFDGGVSDDRINVGDAGTYWFKLRYQYDHVDVDDGWVSLNGTASAAWDAADARWEYGTSREDVVREGYRVAGVGGNAYGITALADEVGTRSIIWDRVVITLSVLDDRINVGDTASVASSVIYDYDDSNFVGSIALNDTLTKDRVGRYAFTVSSIEDRVYGITVFEAEPVTVIYDRIVVEWDVDKDTLKSGEAVRFEVDVTYEFDGKAVTDYSYTVERDGLEATHTSPSFSDVSEERATHVYRFVSVEDRAHGITALTAPPDIVVRWGVLLLADVDVSLVAGGTVARARIAVVEGGGQDVKATFHVNGRPVEAKTVALPVEPAEMTVDFDVPIWARTGSHEFSVSLEPIMGEEAEAMIAKFVLPPLITGSIAGLVMAMPGVTSWALQRFARWILVKRRRKLPTSFPTRPSSQL